jgi:phage terminase large subunit-like protein
MRRLATLSQGTQATTRRRRALKSECWQRETERWRRVAAFLESLPVTKGILSGQRFRLLPDQLEFVRKIYGPRDHPVRIGILSQPRGNGKTGLVAGLALCHLLGPEAERRGEVVSASIDRQMAALVFNEMVAIILEVPEFMSRVNIQRFHKRIEVISGPGAGSVYEALSADARRGHGLAPSLWIYDELAQAPDGELLANLRTAMGKRERSLGLIISTQASDDSHPLSELIDDGLSGADPGIVVHLTMAPPEADPFAEETIRAANPALGVFLDERIVFAEAAQARRMPAYEASFRNLRLNQRVHANTDEVLCQASDWAACETAMEPESLRGRVCYGGLDLSGKHDLTALVLVFPDGDGYDVLAYFWTPEGQLGSRVAIEEERLRQWIRAGYVEAIPGPIVRYSWVGRRIAELATQYELVRLAYDRYRMDELRIELSELGVSLPLDEFGQGHSKPMAQAIEHFHEVLATRRLRHPGNPALTASVLNAVVVPDRAGNPMIDRSRSRRGHVVRIDGAVALLMALGTARRYGASAGWRPL